MNKKLTDRVILQYVDGDNCQLVCCDEFAYVVLHNDQLIKLVNVDGDKKRYINNYYPTQQRAELIADELNERYDTFEFAVYKIIGVEAVDSRTTKLYKKFKTGWRRVK